MSVRCEFGMMEHPLNWRPHFPSRPPALLNHFFLPSLCAIVSKVCSYLCPNPSMASNAITLISQIDRAHKNYRMKLRIIRLWRLPLFTNPVETFGLEMVLMDEEGTKIQAAVARKWVSHFEKLLKEKDTFYMDRPQVEANDLRFKYVDTPYKITIGAETQLKRCSDFAGSAYGFSFVGFDSLINKSIAEGEVVDIIGHVTKMYELEMVAVSGKKETERLNLDVQDTSKRQIRMTLWGAFAKEMVDYVSNNLDKAFVVVLLQFGRLKYYRGLPYISNMFGVTRLVINGDLEEITQFETSLRNELTRGDNADPARTVASIVHTSKHEFLRTYDAVTIAGISSITQQKKTVIVGTIKHIADELPWYYPACNVCGFKVEQGYDVLGDAPGGPVQGEERKILICTNPDCTAPEISPIPRFKVQVRVEDTTGFVFLTMFDRDVSRITQTTARALMTNHEQAAEPNNLPAELSMLLEKKFAFLIEIKEYNFRWNSHIYGVSKMTADLETIYELEMRLGTYEDFAPAAPGNTTPASDVEVALEIPSNAKGKGVAVDAVVGVTSTVKEKLPPIKPAQRNVKRNLNDAYEMTNSPSAPPNKQMSSSNTKRSNASTEAKGMKKI
ncbi:hypothetical protein SSX86_008190 [Deinandra increscens subsp. villosa]|uniref:Nucleic acid-binding, OB-fold protein n=1 Tax=Deinandra increscens subsp. villosa TaxID=3103831 RepID=A0AAP0H4A6_9ASTR